MSAISANTAAAAGSTDPNRLAALASQEFLGIILAELQNQDPLSPNDTNALVEQLSSVRSIASDIALTDKLEALVSDNRVANASSLVGRRVEGIDDAGNSVVGTVGAVRTNDGEPSLLLEDGTRIAVERLTAVGDFAESLR